MGISFLLCHFLDIVYFYISVYKVTTFDALCPGSLFFESKSLLPFRVDKGGEGVQFPSDRYCCGNIAVCYNA